MAEWTGPVGPGAHSPSTWLTPLLTPRGCSRNVGFNRGKEALSSSQRELVLFLRVGTFQLTDRIFGWVPESEHTAQNGSWKAPTPEWHSQWQKEAECAQTAQTAH
jgi:hypothetical protein